MIVEQLSQLFRFNGLDEQLRTTVLLSLQSDL